MKRVRDSAARRRRHIPQIYGIMRHAEEFTGFSAHSGDLPLKTLYLPDGVTTNWRRYRSRKVTGPRGPGTASMLIPVSGTENSLKPSSRRVVEFQNAPVPA